MLSQQLRKSPIPFLSSLFTFKPVPTHIQGILLTLKNKKQHSMQMKPQYWIWTHSHIPGRGQGEHTCTKAGFLSGCCQMLFFYVFSTEHAISFVNRKGTLPHLICEAFVHPGSRWVCLSSVLSLSCASAIIACTTVDFFVFLPIFSTSHEPFKAQGLTCLLPPWCLTLCLAQSSLDE